MFDALKNCHLIDGNAVSSVCYNVVPCLVLPYLLYYEPSLNFIQVIAYNIRQIYKPANPIYRPKCIELIKFKNIDVLPITSLMSMIAKVEELSNKAKNCN